MNDTDVNDKPEYSVPMNDIYGLATFKNLMDNYIIPELLKQDNEFEEDPEKRTLFSNNDFIKMLSYSVATNKKTKSVKTYYKLPLNMMQIDASQKTQLIYERALEGFNKIANEEILG
jgi:hypothetical protein